MTIIAERMFLIIVNNYINNIIIGTYYKFVRFNINILLHLRVSYSKQN